MSTGGRRGCATAPSWLLGSRRHSGGDGRASSAEAWAAMRGGSWASRAAISASTGRGRPPGAAGAARAASFGVGRPRRSPRRASGAVSRTLWISKALWVRAFTAPTPGDAKQPDRFQRSPGGLRGAMAGPAWTARAALMASRVSVFPWLCGSDRSRGDPPRWLPSGTTATADRQIGPRIINATVCVTGVEPESGEGRGSRGGPIRSGSGWFGHFGILAGTYDGTLD